MAHKKNKRKDPQLYTYDKYECWWEDHSSACEWKSIKEAEKDKPQICFTEGYLLKKDKDFEGRQISYRSYKLVSIKSAPYSKFLSRTFLAEQIFCP